MKKRTKEMPLPGGSDSNINFYYSSQKRHKEIDEEAKQIEKEKKEGIRDKIGRLIRKALYSPTECRICRKPLKRNNVGQVQVYCSDECRKKRHNKLTKKERRNAGRKHKKVSVN